MTRTSGPSRPERELLVAAAALAGLGLASGSSGNVSVRLDGRMVITASGATMASLGQDELATMSMDGAESRHTAGPRPSKEAGLHRAMYARDDAVRAVVHLHSPYAVAASCLRPWSAFSALPPLTPYLLMRLGNLPLVPYAPPGDPRQAQDVLELSARCHGVLLQNHGSLAAGETVQEAVDRAVEIEQAARTVVTLAGHEHVHRLSDDEAAVLAASYGRPWGPGAPATPGGR